MKKNLVVGKAVWGLVLGISMLAGCNGEVAPSNVFGELPGLVDNLTKAQGRLASQIQNTTIPPMTMNTKRDEADYTRIAEFRALDAEFQSKLYFLSENYLLQNANIDINIYKYGSNVFFVKQNPEVVIQDAKILTESLLYLENALVEADEEYGDIYEAAMTLRDHKLSLCNLIDRATIGIQQLKTQYQRYLAFQGQLEEIDRKVEKTIQDAERVLQSY